MANHKLNAHTLHFTAKTGSRNRVRIPVAGTRFAENIKPGTRVNVRFNTLGVTVELAPQGKYKVEKDGAVRFPAHAYQLPTKNLAIAAEKLKNSVAVTF